MRWSYYHHPSARTRYMPHCFNIYLNFFLRVIKKLCRVLSFTLPNTIKTSEKKSTTTKFRASSTSHFFTLNSARRHSLCIYFLYKVNSHISPLLKVFTLLRYLLCEHFHRILCGIVVDYLFLLVLCYCAYVLYTFFPSFRSLFRAQERIGFFFNTSKTFVTGENYNVSSHLTVALLLINKSISAIFLWQMISYNCNNTFNETFSAPHPQNQSKNRETTQILSLEI